MNIIRSRDGRVRGSAQQDRVRVLLHTDLLALCIAQPIVRLRFDLLQERHDIDRAHHSGEIAQRSVEAVVVHAHRLRGKLRPPPAPEVILAIAQSRKDLRYRTIEETGKLYKVHGSSFTSSPLPTRPELHWQLLPSYARQVVLGDATCRGAIGPASRDASQRERNLRLSRPC
jgi:hypothetical protein